MLRTLGRVISRIAVDEHIDVRFNVGEHAPHNVALALMDSRRTTAPA